MSPKRREVERAHETARPNPAPVQEHGIGPRINGVFLWSPARPTELLLWGGETALDGSRSRPHCLRPRFPGDIALYDTRRAAWTVLPARGAQPAARASAQAALVDSGRAAVVFGGESQGVPADSAAARKKRRSDDVFVHYSDTWVLDVAELSWRLLPTRTHPSARSGHRMASVDGVRFVALFGGFHDVGAGARYLDDLWLFDAAAAQWTCVAAFESGPVSRPAARSGAVFQRVTLSNSPDGTKLVSLLLVGGYCMQTPPGAKKPAGVVLADQWLLTLRIPPSATSGADVVCAWRQLRSPRVGTALSRASQADAADSFDAKASRSGRSAVALSPAAMLFCGGVADEEDATGECISGTCANGLALLSYDAESVRAEWRVLGGAPLPADMCPRFGPMMAAVPCAGATDVYVLGGAFEVGERQIVLDDMHRVRVEADGHWALECVQPLSPALADCHLLVPESDSGSDCSSSDGDDDSESLDDYSSSDSDTPADDPGTHKTLKAFFDATAQHWLAEARREAAVSQSDSSEKDVRMRAFALAKQRWDEHAQASDLLGSADLGLGKKRH